MSEKDIISGCVKGDRESQEIIYKRFYPVAFKTCMRFAKSTDAGHDQIQESFIKMFKKVNKFNGDSYNEFGAWFKILVRNVSIDANRKKTLDIVKVEDLFEGYFDEYFDAFISHEEEEVEESEFTITEIVEAVEQLSPRYKSVFKMYMLDGLTHQEIADILDVKPDTSKANLFKAKHNLRKILKPETIAS